MSEQANVPFKTISETFKLIGSETTPVYIPCEESAELIDKLEHWDMSDRDLFRKLGQFAVNVKKNDLETLQKMSALKTVNDTYILSDSSLYNSETGLQIPKI